ncbi:MAG: polysaccharide deacetylase [Cyclobacteriaceae bacterium]
MHSFLKSNLSKINFELGRNPRIEKADNFRKFVPQPYKAVFHLSADFELAWAWRYSKKHQDPLQEAVQRARRARKNMPEILRLCDEYCVPISWATVGHLFLESCDCNEQQQAHAKLTRIPHFENDYWRYDQGDWFDDDPCSSLQEAPEWYCPDLLDKIQASEVPHEIGCHTFSHIDCRDGICPPQVMADELQECRELARQRNISLKSFIFPAHTVGNLDVLAAAGFTNYRSNLGNVLGFPVKHANGLWEIKSSYHLEKRKEWSADYQIYRIRKVIDRAIQNNTVCHFWFHPSFPSSYLHEIVPSVFAYLNEKREDILLTTTGDYTDWLNGELSTEALCEAGIGSSEKVG